MFLQTDERLNSMINKYGCYLLSILEMCSRECQIYLSHMDIRDCYYYFTLLKKEKGMDKECMIYNPNEIIKWYFRLHNQKQTIKYEGTHSQQYIADDNIKYIIGVFTYKYSHRVLMDGKGKYKRNVLYDPLGQSFSVDKGTLTSTRLFIDV